MDFEQERPWEVMDINFVTTDWTELDMLTEMDGLDRDKKKKIYALQKLQETPEQAEDNAEEIEKVNEASAEVLEQYNAIKKQYIAIQEEKLYEAWTMTEDNGRTEKT
jgi:pantothenate synthetase